MIRLQKIMEAYRLVKPAMIKSKGEIEQHPS
jgi:hypothetical protein